MAICSTCGEWTEPPLLITDDHGGVRIACPQCGHREPFVQRPLYFVSGASGAGKSTLVPLVRPSLPDYVIFECEAIDFWRFEGPPGEYASLHNQWLKVAWEIALNDLPVVLFGTALPAQLDACTMRSRFSTIRYLGLICDDEELARRLRARPAWRKTRNEQFIAQAQGYTRRLREVGEGGTAAMTLVDTTAMLPDEAAACIVRWVRASHAPMTQDRG